MSKINDLRQLVLNNANESEVGDLVLNFFKKEFNTEDYAHLFRQERWKYGIYCPFCESNNIKKKHVNPKTHLLQYLCLDCNSLFEDNSDSPLSGSIIPLNIWLQCWYLSQYCNSLQYMAEKLNLDINIIINILHGLQHLFKTETALLKNKDSKEIITNLNKNNAKHSEEKFKKFLLLGGDTGKQPIDTAEYRRQKKIKTKHIKNSKKPNF